MAWPDSFVTFLRGGVIPLPGRGIVGKNRSAQSKTTVRSKRVFPLKVWRAPLPCVPQRRIVLLEIRSSSPKIGLALIQTLLTMVDCLLTQQNYQSSFKSNLNSSNIQVFEHSNIKYTNIQNFRNLN